MKSAYSLLNKKSMESSGKKSIVRSQILKVGKEF